MKNHLVTFASSDLNQSLRRIGDQANELKFFSTVHVCNQQDLSADFRNRHRSLLKFHTRGFGYWIWKPRIILDVLNKLPSGDRLLYLDVGCHINPKGIDRLKYYFEMVDKSENGILALQYYPPTKPFVYDGRDLPDFRDGIWTKGDILDHFGVRHDKTITETQTIGAGVILARNVPQAVYFLENWLIQMEQNITLLDDSKSKSENLSGFRENRHDQAFFSILCKMVNVPTLCAFENWYPNKHSNGSDWEALENYPIQARRDMKRTRIQNLWRRIRKKLVRYNFI